MTGKDDNDTSPLDDGGDWIDRDDDNAPGPVIDRDDDEALPIDPPPRTPTFPEERDYPEVPDWDDDISDPDSLPDWDAPSADNDDLNRLAERELADLDDEPYPAGADASPPPTDTAPPAPVGGTALAEDFSDSDSSDSLGLDDSSSETLDSVSADQPLDDPLAGAAEERWRAPPGVEDDDSWSDDSEPAAATYRGAAAPDADTREPTRDMPLDAANGNAGSRRWPVAMLAVAALAVVLLAVGGYGVISERAALQADIRQLQAQLATAISPEEARASRDAQEAMAQDMAALEAEIQALRSENSELQQAARDLEARAEAQARAAEEAVAEAQAAAAAAASRRAAAATSAAGGDWFVNFGSYANAAVAKRWASRLKVDSGSVVVQDARTGGDTIYRVRVVGLAGKAAADRVARQLETEHKLPKLWVGKD